VKNSLRVGITRLDSRARTDFPDACAPTRPRTRGGSLEDNGFRRRHGSTAHTIHERRLLHGNVGGGGHDQSTQVSIYKRANAGTLSWVSKTRGGRFARHRRGSRRGSFGSDASSLVPPAVDAVHDRRVRATADQWPPNVSAEKSGPRGRKELGRAED
jgi:hypothetical protein